METSMNWTALIMMLEEVAVHAPELFADAKKLYDDVVAAMAKKGAVPPPDHADRVAAAAQKAAP